MGRVDVENVLDVAYQNEISTVYQVVDAELEVHLEHPIHIIEEISREELDMLKNVEDKEEIFEVDKQIGVKEISIEDKWIDEEQTSEEDDWIDEEETSEEDNCNSFFLLN